MQNPRILYCHCAFAKVVPPETKAAVLKGLAEADVEFDAVPDLCEMAARADPRLKELASNGPIRIAACYPRAVKWLFASAGANVDPSAMTVRNMRTESSERVLQGLLVRLTPDATTEEVRLTPDATTEEIRLTPDATTENDT